ncbi:hypothetical protein C5C07_19720 [Haloferax sp. Atlit-4N]|nr:hypothetical protein C5C07_19720 [Haloferax sp. Atlit-4N]
MSPRQHSTQLASRIARTLHLDRLQQSEAASLLFVVLSFDASVLLVSMEYISIPVLPTMALEIYSVLHIALFAFLALGYREWFIDGFAALNTKSANSAGSVSRKNLMECDCGSQKAIRFKMADCPECGRSCIRVAL